MYKKYFLIVVIGITFANTTQKLQARRFMPSFFDIEDEMNQMFKSMKKSMKEMRRQFFVRPSKEEREAIKNARENLAKIEPSISKDENNNVIIKFPLYNVDKKAIAPVEINENVASGLIPTEFGKIAYYVTPSHIEITKSLEIKKEEKPKVQEDKKATQDKKEGDEKAAQESTISALPKYSYVQYGSTSSLVHSLPLTVDIKSAEPETQFNKEKNVDELIIRFAPRSYLKKEVQHK